MLDPSAETCGGTWLRNLATELVVLFTCVLAACIAGCGDDTTLDVDGGSRVDLGPMAADMGPRCAPRPSGDTRWPQYPLPGTEGHPRTYDVVGAAGAETVIDCVTGLEWPRAVAPGAYTRADAIAYCDGLTLAGYTDWRLPSRIELLTLVDYSVAGSGPTIDTSAFPGTPAAAFWSASFFADSTVAGWFVSFSDGRAVGNAYIQFTDHYGARCVR